VFAAKYEPANIWQDKPWVWDTILEMCFSPQSLSLLEHKIRILRSKRERDWGFISLFKRFHLPRVILPKTRKLVFGKHTLGYLNHCP